MTKKVVKKATVKKAVKPTLKPRTHKRSSPEDRAVGPVTVTPSTEELRERLAQDESDIRESQEVSPGCSVSLLRKHGTGPVIGRGLLSSVQRVPRYWDSEVQGGS